MWGDPIARIEKTRYVDAETLAAEVAKLKPTLGDRTSILRHLRGLDETGELRPQWRLVLPETYIDWATARLFETPAKALSNEEAQLFQAVATSVMGYPTGRAWEHALFGSCTETDAHALLERGDARSCIQWSQWLRTDGASRARRPRAYAFYLHHDWYLLWASLLDRTANVLLCHDSNGHELAARLWPNCSPLPSPPGDKHIALSMRGGYGGRLTKLANELLSDTWLGDVYKFQQIVSATNAHPIAGSVDGASLAGIRESALAELSQPWLEREPEFRSNFARLVEFGLHVQEQGFSAAHRRIRSDAFSALDWMVAAFGINYADALSGISCTVIVEKRTLGHLLQPTLTKARTDTEFLARVFASAVGAWSEHVPLSEDDFHQFFAWLIKNGASAFALALSEAHAELQSPSDAHGERLAIYMLALAAQVESILDLLSEQFSGQKDPDRELKNKLGMFLAQRGGWRGRLWQQVGSSHHWKLLAGLPKKAARSENWWHDRMQLNTDMEAKGELDGAAAAILTFAFVRHALAHVFVPWETVTRGWKGRALYACAYTPCLYWKLAQD